MDSEEKHELMEKVKEKMNEMSAQDIAGIMQHLTSEARRKKETSDRRPMTASIISVILKRPEKEVTRMNDNDREQIQLSACKRLENMSCKEVAHLMVKLKPVERADMLQYVPLTQMTEIMQIYSQTNANLEASEQSKLLSQVKSAHNDQMMDAMN